jgi:perosamine synthetase
MLSTSVSDESLISGALDALRRVLGPSGGGIALHEPVFSGREWDFVKDCLDTGWVSTAGSYVDRFERDLCETTGVPFAVATANGTTALHMCLLLAGVKPGDEVLVPALTFVATANAVSHAVATPHFVDSEDKTLGVDAEALDAYLGDIVEMRGGEAFNRRTGARIRALVVMHVFGHPCDLDALTAVAERWSLVLVEDAAESLGSRYRGRHTGCVGLLAALSFNGNKVITTGGGGAILTRDPVLGQRAKHLTTTARVPHRWGFLHDEIGYNYRLPNLNAALGCAQLERLPEFVASKRRLAQEYELAFANIDGMQVLMEPEFGESNYWLVTLMLSEERAGLRDELLKVFNDEGYMSRPVWTLMHKLPMYSDCPRMPLPVAESLEARIVNVPSSPHLGSVRL